MVVPQLQTDQTGHRNKARLGFIEETAFDASATICYWYVRSEQELVKFIGKSYQFVKQWAETEMELSTDAEDLAKRVLRHSHDMY